MKKFKKLFVILFVLMTFLPAGVKAEIEKPEANKEPVKVYMFRGSTCSFCEKALEWFDSIEDEYGDYFDLITYEVWNDTDNAALMEEAAEMMGDTASGVPYIIVGEYTYPNGFSADSIVSSDSDQTMGDQLIERILEVYQSDNRYDVIKAINNKPDYSNIVGTVAIIVIAGLIIIAVVSRRQNSRG